MPGMTFDANGLVIQTLDEIKLELEADYKGVYGDNVNLLPGSVIGERIKISSERESKAQQVALGVWEAYSGQTAGVPLDRISELTGTFRKDATKSTSVGKATGTNGVDIEDGFIVKLIATQTEWEVFDGPYEIGSVVSGEVSGIKIRALLAGATVALTADTTAWEIVTVTVGWDDFETTEDAEVGREDEVNFAMRNRRRNEFLVQGNDIDAIAAEVSKVENNNFVRVYENTTDAVDGEGRLPRSIEVVADGGTDAEVADAILRKLPPGITMHGSTSVIRLMTNGDTIEIKLTRPTDVDITVVVTIDTTNAENSLPEGFEADIKAAVATQGNANHTYGTDVNADWFCTAVFGVIGVGTSSNLAITADKGGGPLGFIAIGDTERARFDSTDVTVTVI